MSKDLILNTFVSFWKTPNFIIHRLENQILNDLMQSIDRILVTLIVSIILDLVQGIFHGCQSFCILIVDGVDLQDWLISLSLFTQLLEGARDS